MTAPLSWRLDGDDRLSEILEKLDRNLTKLSRRFDGVSADARGMGSELGRAGEKAKHASSRFEGMANSAKEMVGKLKAVGVAAGLALGVAVGAGAVKGFDTALDQEALGAKLSAQLRADPGEAKRWGAAAGHLYADAFGDSLESTHNAVRAVIANIDGLRSASTEDIEAITSKALRLATTFELDVGQAARAAGKLIQTGLVKDASEAFDLLAAGFAGTNLDQAGDLLDTISEYSTQFRELGIEGPKALGLMSQGLRAGARDADTVADAIKEFAIRSKDGSKLSAKAFKDLGLDAKAMFAVFARGGPEADQAMRKVLEQLARMKDPVLHNATAIALFGTKAEDLGAALSALDPTTAVEALGKVGGAADELGEKLDNTAKAKITSWLRTVEMSLSEVATRVISKAGTMREDIAKIFSGSAVPGQLIDKLKELRDKIMPKLEEAWGKILKTVSDNREGLEKFGRFVAEYVIPFVGTELVLAIDTVTFAFQAIVIAVAHVVDAIQFMAFNTLNMLGIILHGATDAWSWVPGLGPKLAEATKKFDSWAQGVLNQLAKLDGKDVTVDVKLRYHGDKSAYWMQVIDKEISGRAAGGPAWAGEVYRWQENGEEYFVPGSTGRVASNAEARSMASRGGGSGILGTIRIVQVTPDGKELQEKLLQLKRDRGYVTLGLA